MAESKGKYLISERDLLNKVIQLKAAIEYEKSLMYINALGNSTSFSEFIIKESKAALKVFKHSTKWASIKALISRYEFVDVSTRINLLKKISETLVELEEFYLRALGELPQEKSEKFIGQSLKKKIKEETIEVENISDFDLRYVKGIGPVLATKLGEIGVNNVEDLLNYLPRKHVSYKDKVLIKDLMLDQDVTILGEVDKVTAFKLPKKDLVVITIVIKDPTGKVKVTKFLKAKSTHIILSQFKKQYPIGAQVLCAGTIKEDKYSKGYQVSNPVLEVIADDFIEGRDNIHTGRIVPIYPLTEGLSLMQLRKIIYNAINLYSSNLKDFVPQEVLMKHGLMGYREALQEIHFPQSEEAKDKASARLIFNEFFLMQLRFAQRRHHVKQQKKNIEFNCFENGLVDKFIASLPFELTYAQQRVFFSELLPDMVSESPMHRLIQGDVGCGKTVVAFLALLIAVDSGFQTAIMAPTEILAEQHYRSFQEWVAQLSQHGEGLGMKIGLLTGRMRAKPKRETLQGLANGEIKIVVGTHALIQEGVEFENLGLVIIDEQHRFGVKQRDVLTKKGKDGGAKSVERLFMSATPIPRTLALSMHGDLDVSEIDEMPQGRLPVKTEIVRKKSDAYKKIREEINQGHQAYVVFPLIDESESLSAKAATVEFEKLKEKIFPDLRIGLMHGKLPDDEKENIMSEFRKGNLDILVSTTVIEVGVDVPNSTVMLIESAERFGLAQLHQLRGRVGRGKDQAYCLLSSNSSSPLNQTRLNILTNTSNGFVVALEDMKLRGAGDFLGTRQSGLPDFALANISEHEEMLTFARNSAMELIEKDPELKQYGLLRKRLENSPYAGLLAAG